MNKDAGVVYDYLMTQDTPSQDARVGAINVALAQNNVQRANELLDDVAAYQAMARAHNPYGDGKACDRIVRALKGEQVDRYEIK